MLIPGLALHITPEAYRRKVLLVLIYSHLITVSTPHFSTMVSYEAIVLFLCLKIVTARLGGGLKSVLLDLLVAILGIRAFKREVKIWN